MHIVLMGANDLEQGEVPTDSGKVVHPGIGVVGAIGAGVDEPLHPQVGEQTFSLGVVEMAAQNATVNLTPERPGPEHGRSSHDPDGHLVILATTWRTT